MIDVEVKNGALELLPAMRRWSRLTHGDLLRRTAKITLAQAKRRFQTTKSPDLKNWAARKGPPPWPPLYKTGAMFRALRISGGPGNMHAGIWEGAGGNPGAGLLAHWHQKGTRRNGMPYMPARPFIGVGARDEQQIEALIDGFVRMRFDR